MARFLKLVRITDPGRSRAFYEALGFRFERDMDIVQGRAQTLDTKRGDVP